MTDWFHWYYAPGYMSGAILLGTMLRRQWRYALASAVLFWVWSVCTFYWFAAGHEMIWYATALIDIAAAAMLIRFGGRMEALLAMSLGFQVLCLVVYGFYRHMHWITSYTEWVRWWTAFDIACVQAIIVAGASISGGGRRIIDRGDVDIAYSGLFGLEGGLQQALAEREAQELIGVSRRR